MKKVTDLKPNEAILISNDADLKVLEEFEKAGITWIDGANANSFNPLAFSGEEELIIHIEQDRIVWAYSQVSVLTTYPATDFIGSDGEDEGSTIESVFKLADWILKHRVSSLIDADIPQQDKDRISRYFGYSADFTNP
jgi:hypothetical protein